MALIQFILVEEGGGDQTLINVGQIVKVKNTGGFGEVFFQKATGTGLDSILTIRPFDEVVNSLDKFNQWPVRALTPPLP
jgi:hypothetical protein